jgi:hypothetical protein
VTIGGLKHAEAAGTCGHALSRPKRGPRRPAGGIMPAPMIQFEGFFDNYAEKIVA